MDYIQMRHATESSVVEVIDLAVNVETDYKEVIGGRPIGVCPCGCYGTRRIPYSRISRMMEVSHIAEALRNFPITALRDEEIGRFEELQDFFFRLEAECFDEAGVE